MITLGAIVKGLPILHRLANEPMSLKTLYWTNKLLRRLEKEIAFFNDKQGEIVRELGEQTEDGKWRINGEHTADFERRMQELISIEIDDDFKAARIPTTETISLSYNDLCTLDGLIELYDTEE